MCCSSTQLRYPQKEEDSFRLVSLWSMTVCMNRVRDYSLFVHR